MPALDTELETSQPKTLGTLPETTSESTPSNLGVSVDSLPRVVMCFDISTLSHRKLKAIATDLKLPGYSRMTKEQLCEALLLL